MFSVINGNQNFEYRFQVRIRVWVDNKLAITVHLFQAETDTRIHFIDGKQRMRVNQQS